MFQHIPKTNSPISSRKPAASTPIQQTATPVTTSNSPSLSPQQILHLQRNIGNRAVTRLLRKPRIQRTFQDGTEFVDGLNLTTANAHLTRMGEIMTEFNEYLDIDNKGAMDFAKGARLLKELDFNIHQYLDSQNATHEKLEDIPHYTAVMAVRTQAAKEHEDLVEQSSNTPGSLPFDLSGMDRTEGFKLIMLWNKIKNGTGKIQVLGDDDHKKKIYSWLVKLLETPTGRKLLSYLNAGDPNELMTNIYLGQTKDQLPEGVEKEAKKRGKELEDVDHSEAQPLGNSEEIRGPQDPDGTENPRDFPTALTTADFRDALTAGKKGVIFKGKKYIFNVSGGQGIGAFVTAHEGASKSGSSVHHQIFTPGWVTMGHELGHAAHMRGGATSMVNSELMKEITGKDEEELNMVWQNNEELMTIQNWENALRSDVGITNRASHIPYAAGKKVERYFSIYSDFKATYTNVNPYFVNIPELSDFKTRLTRAFNSKTNTDNLENDTVFGDLRNEWATLKTQFTVEDIKPIQKTMLDDPYGKLLTKYAAKKRIYDGKYKIFMKNAKKQGWLALKTEYEDVKDKYDNHLDDYLGTVKVFKDFKEKVDTLQYKIGQYQF